MTFYTNPQARKGSCLAQPRTESNNMTTTPNENEWIRIILLLADTQSWLNELCGQTLAGLHPPAKKLLAAKTYRLTIGGLAHILERHYYKTLRHPGTGKFRISLPQIIDLLKLAGSEPPGQMTGTLNQVRVLNCEESIGTDKEGNDCRRLTVITDPGGCILTAFPGELAPVGRAPGRKEEWF
jgi:hypothetical protein